MSLLTTIKEATSKRKDSGQIAQAIQHEQKLAFHAKPILNKWRLSPYSRDWEAKFPAFLLPDNTAEKVMQIISLPLSTVDLTGSIFSEISRIFNAQNKSISYEFTGVDEREDFEVYTKDAFDIEEFMRNDVFNAFKWAINSIVVMDLPNNQSSLRPEPYAFVLSIDNVLAAAPDKNGGFEYLVYKYEDFIFALTKDKYYKLDKDLEVVLIEEDHGLGYVPAHFMWHKLITTENRYDHYSPITNVLGELDWYLFFKPSKKYNDLTAAFPIYVGYDEECDYEYEGVQCESGWLGGDHSKPCPNCSKKALIGPGSMITVPAPADKDDPDLGANPVSKLDADTGSLKYCREEVADQALHIFNSSVGVDHGENVDVAKNSEQVSSLYESRANILMQLKEGFEIIHKWIVDTTCDLRYGNTYIGCTINYGTEFFLKTLGELYKQYTSAKSDGLPDSELDTIYSQIINIKYKNNDTQRRRLNLLLNLEPYPHKTIEEITTLYEKDLIDREDFVIKINFNSFVKRFERENGLIESFGSLADMKTRVDNINKKFKEYVGEKLPAKTEGSTPLPRGVQDS